MMDLNKVILMVHSMEYHWGKTELLWDILMELNMGLNLGFMKKLSWVFLFSLPECITMSSLMVVTHLW